MHLNGYLLFSIQALPFSMKHLRFSPPAPTHPLLPSPSAHSPSRYLLLLSARDAPLKCLVTPSFVQVVAQKFRTRTFATNADSNFPYLNRPPAPVWHRQSQHMVWDSRSHEARSPLHTAKRQRIHRTTTHLLAPSVVAAATRSLLSPPAQPAPRPPLRMTVKGQHRSRQDHIV